MVRFRYGSFLVALGALGVGCQSLPTAEPTPPPVTTAAPVTAHEPVLPHQTFTLESRVLAETRRINVYTPPGYAEAEDARYTVLYMPDGGVEEDFPHVIRTVDTAIRAGEIRPLIVVGIENTERRRDMTGPTQVEEDRKIAPRVGGSASFRAFLRDELMPDIRQRVRGNGETAIMGESLAGLFVVETFLLEPGMFDAGIAISPALWWNDQALVHGAVERLKARSARPTTLYLTRAGDDDIGAAPEALAAALRSAAPKTLTWFFEPMPGEKHSTIYRAVSAIALRKVLPPRTAPALPRPPP